MLDHFIQLVQARLSLPWSFALYICSYINVTHACMTCTYICSNFMTFCSVVHFSGHEYLSIMEETKAEVRYGWDGHRGAVGRGFGGRRGRGRGRTSGRGRGQIRGRGRDSPVLGASDFVVDSDGHSPAERSRPDRGRSDRGRRRGKGQRRGRGHGYGLDMPHAAVGAPHHQRTQFRGKKRYPTVVGPSHAESLSWIQELKSLSSDDLVDAVENDLKTFQDFINHDHKIDLKEMSNIIFILVQLSHCSMDKKEAANRVLAECISDRCEPFHLQLLHSVQQVAHNHDRHSINYVLLLVDLCCALLDQFHYGAMAVLPVTEIQREVQTLAKDNPTEAKLQRANEELHIRIDRISHTVTDLAQVEGKVTQVISHGPGKEEDEIYTFSTTSILPDSDELRSREVPMLTPNIIEGRYKSWDHYYNTQFHLLREDFVVPLRQGICDYVDGLRGRDLQDIRVYNGVHILQPEFDRQGVSYCIQFNTDKLKYVKWHRTKRLIYGSLVCLSNDGFTSNMVFASISNRDPKELENGMVQIKPEGDSAFLPWNTHQEYVMVESSAYYEAYRHILSSLQNAEVNTMPFKQYLVDVDCEEVGQPTYLNQSGTPSVYDLSSALSCASTLVALTEDVSWPKASRTQLDSSQMKAMKMALTQDVALIQGPPGTGKTYMGTKIVEALVHNRSVWDPRNTSPILVVCFTNHALDQFLNGIKQIEVTGMQKRLFFGEFNSKPINIVRVGGRADESMERYTLKNIRRGAIPKEEFMALRKHRESLDEEGTFLSQQMAMLNHDYSEILSVQDLTSVLSAFHYQQLLSICQPSPVDPPNLHLLLWLGLHELCVHEPQKASESEKVSNEKTRDENDDANMPSDDGEIGRFITKEEYAAVVESHVKDDSAATSHLDGEHPTNQWQTLSSNPSVVSTHSEVYDHGLKLEPAGPDSSFPETETVMGNDDQLVGIDEELELERDLQRLYFGEEEVYAASQSQCSSPTDIHNEEELIAVEDEVTLEEDSRKIYFGNDESQVEYQQLPSSLANNVPLYHAHMEVESSQYECTSRPVKSYKKKRNQLRHCIPLTEEQIDEITDISTLPEKMRWSLYSFWLEKLKTNDISWQFEHFNNLCKVYRDIDQMHDCYALQRVHVIGMTTTGAAKYQHILQMVKPKIVIVEEAAEVLESHIVSCLTASTQHLILIGDHQQLRPKPNVYELAKKYNLDISLFERLVRNDFPRVTLEIQHRMRPEIAELVHPLIYPVLENHASVCGYENVKGMSNNMFFIDHRELEKPNDELRSHSNIHEAKFLAAFCRYLIRQEYRPEQITVLCAYTGQLFEVQKHMPKREFFGVKVRTLDNYQGEENDIVLLSLVRSNTAKSIGFLRAEHRVCVALSRAKMGFYCIGNFQLLQKEGEIWERLVPTLEAKEVIGPALKLRCANHPNTVTEIITAEDFSKVPEGGCSLDCGVRLDCGHACKLKCHSYDCNHVKYKCRQVCPKTCKVGHDCHCQCHHPEPCPPCKVLVEKVIPTCGHSQSMHCCQDPGGIDVLCRTLVTVTCIRGHEVHKKCHKKDDPCKESVTANIPKCGHSQVIKCYENVDIVACKSPCERGLECGHRCEKTCGETCTTKCLQRVEKRKSCGHTLSVMCYQNIYAVVCPEACERTLRCGHRCKKVCGAPCEESCQETVEKKLDCGHCYMKVCSSTKEMICNVAVKKQLLCGHSAVMPCAQNHFLFVCNETMISTLSCGHRKKIKCSEKASSQCTETVKVKQPCGHFVKTKCAERNRKFNCAYPCQHVLACSHLCTGTCGKCFMGRLHVQCSRNVTFILPCGHFSHMKCYEQYGSYHCKAKCEFSCHHRLCQQGKVPCDGVRCPSLDCSQPCSWSCPHVRCDKKCKEPCGVPPCNEPCPKPLRCKHPCEGLCGETCPTICRQCNKRSKKKSKSQAQMGHPMTKDENCRFIQLRCSHIYEVPFLDRYMHSDEGPGEKKVGIKVCLKCHKPIYGIHRYHDLTKKAMQMLQSLNAQRPLRWQCPVPRFLSSLQRRLIKKIADNPNEGGHVSGSQHLPKLELPHHAAATNVFSTQQCEIMRQIISYVNVFVDDLKDSTPVILKHVGTDIITEVLTSFCHLNEFEWPGTPQGVHDWVKEIIRLQLLIILLMCKRLVNSGSKKMPLGVLNQLQRILCEPPRTKGGAAGGALSLQDLRHIEGKLFEMNPVYEMTQITDFKLPLFSSTEWYECRRGHLYCKFTWSGLKSDLFHHLQDGCPVCSKVQLEHHCTIVPK